jgi:hypothetical protein
VEETLMKKYSNPLDHVDVAAPCSAAWNEMTGTDAQRFCGQCEKNVYNLSGMSREEAEALIINTEGRLCVRFYRRADGTILTNNCPVGLLAIKRRLSRLKRATASALLSFLAGLGLYAALDKKESKEPVITMGALAASSTMKEVTEQPATSNPPREGWIAGGMERMPVTMGRVKFTPLHKNYDRR